MLVVLFLLIWGINIFLSITGKNSKLFNIVSILFLLILFCGNTLNGDYSGYKWRYDTAQTEVFDWGYSILAGKIRQLGFSYNGFVALLVIPIYGILFYIGKKLRTNISTFFFLYFFILVFYDINQVRNFVAAIFLTLGLYFLMQKKKVWYCICLLIAFQFHSIAILYLIVLFIDEKMIRKKNIYYFLGIGIVGACVILRIINNNQFIQPIISAMSNNSGVIIYGETKVGFGFIIPFVCYGLNVLLVFYSIKILNKYNQCENNKELISICVRTLIFSACFLPLLMLNLTFDRIFRNFNYIIYFLAGITVNSIPNKSYNKYSISLQSLKYFAVLVLYGIIWSVGTVFRYNGLSQLEWDLILHHNMFF